MSAHYEPSSEIGGDFWGLKTINASQTAFWMVDFSGHGITAALNAFRVQAYLKEESPIALSPGEYLTYLNTKLLHLLARGQFATMFYGIWDTKASKLSYSCACSPNPLLLRSATGQVELLKGRGNLLGVDMHRYVTLDVPMQQGDTLILYSDALIETPNDDGVCITEQDLVALVERHAGSSSAELKQIIIDYFVIHSGGKIADDFTLCICKKPTK